MKPFFGWLGAFYTVWLAIVIAGDHWNTLKEHVGIAVAMLAGSYFAGSTPMGGGTVGFPVLVMMMEGPVNLGRDFSFAIQSIGMTSATIFILCRRQPLQYRMLGYSLLGSLVGTPIGVLFIAPSASELLVKVTFALLWGSFGILHLFKINEISAHQGSTPAGHVFDRACGLTIGALGGATVSSVTGVGVDMLMYAALVLLCHTDLKVAIPTSVVIMAFTSLVGSATKALTTGFAPAVTDHWLAAAPVVALGAPLGALAVDKLGRKASLLVVSILCVTQLWWTLLKERHNLGHIGMTASVLALLVFLLLFSVMHRTGHRRARLLAASNAVPDPEIDESAVAGATTTLRA